tara:strand:+ start:1604 stop:3079 length:1476 start_codon:yes stop_codon:yes gene_type:complete
MRKLNDFKTANWVRCGNRVIQTIMALTLLVAINWMAAHFYLRKPLMQGAGYSLSPETLAYLQKVEDPLEVIVTFTPNSEEPGSEDVYAYIKSLLKEYDYAMRSVGENMFEVEYVDLYKERKRAEELASKYKLQRTNSVLIASGDKYYQILDTDFYDAKNGQISGFKGEQAVTKAILSIISKKHPKIYFLSGHGEMSLDSVDPIRGLSQVSGILRSKGLEASSLDLSLVSKVPEDADLVMVVSPQVALLASEVEKLRQYLEERQGTLAVFMDPVKPHGLTNLLLDWGIVVDDAIVYDVGQEYQNPDGDIIIRRFAEHSINSSLIDYRLTVLAGLTRPVRVDLGRPFDKKRKAMALMASSDQSWGEGGRAVFKNPEYDADKDIPGPLSLAVLSEETVASHLGLSIPGGRVLVLGNSDVIVNHRLGLLGNEMLLFGILSWAFKDDEVLRVDPVTFEYHQLAISQEEFLRYLRYCLGLPAFIGMIGLAVFLKRKN